MQIVIAVLIGQLIATITKLFKLGGGTAAPGFYALKIDPNLVAKLGRQIPRHVVITGTNGKTTTARFLANFCRAQGLTVLRNTTGSNLERGVASALISASRTLTGQVKKIDLAIWELDEAAFNQVTPAIKPQVIVFLNVFRDQLDRYGEVDNVIKRWRKTLSNLNQDPILIINGDDQNLLQLKKSFSGKTQLFGVKDYKIEGEKVIQKSEREKLDLEAYQVKTRNIKQTKFNIEIPSGKLEVTLPLPGIYNIYNFLAAFACGQKLGLENNLMIESLKIFSPAFGRVERLVLDNGKESYIFLIKNPAGATQVFQTLHPQLKSDDRLLIALNDNLADGTDVSWIWDANFEKLKVKSEKLKVFVSGTRAEDLSLRLKYAGFKSGQLIVESKLEKALEQAKKGLQGRLFVLPTYTAMLKLQGILARLGFKSDYWRGQ